MRRTFRLKLLSIVATAGFGLAVLLITSAFVERSVEDQLAQIREQYIPKIGLRENLQSRFERVSRQLRDATEAAEVEQLDEARKHKTNLLDHINASRDAIDASDAAQLRTAIEDYYQAAETVARRMIRGDTGADLPDAQQAMQAKQATVDALIARAGQFDELGLSKAFTAVEQAQAAGARVRFVISSALLVIVLALSLWITRGMYRTLADLGTGIRLFGEGKLDREIPTTDDELGAVAKDANQMAARLRQLDEERDRNDWLKAGQVGLATELRGELQPRDVADRAVAFLARYIGAPAGVVYYEDVDGKMKACGSYGVALDNAAGGLVDEAVRRSTVTVMAAPAGRIPLRSGFTAGDPKSIVFIPLVHADRVRGVIELAVLADWTPAQEELVLAVRNAIAIAIEGARTRSATHDLLDRTQRQAAELLSARRDLEQKAEELARASAYKSQFLANMSHELRTPLNAIIGFSELLFDDAIPRDSAEAKEFIGDILTSGRHLLQLINDVLDLSKVEAGKIEFLPEPTKLTTVIGEVSGILKTVAAKNRVRIVTSVAPEVDEVTLDPARLKQVLYNYMSNALKFTPADGVVTVRVSPHGGDLIMLEVEDTGIGISDEDQQKLFRDFQQTREGSQQRGGTGLGLALTKRLVEAQGGTVGVRSTVGKGSVFHAILPRVFAGAPPASVSIERTGAPTVLVIEDDAADREQLVTTLAKAGYAIDAVATGKQALERCAERSYDAITLDLLLPDMNGLEVLRALRSGKNGRVPVVLVTVVADRGAVAGFAVHDVLAKPLDEGALVATLTRAGLSTAPGDKVVLVVDDEAASLKVMSATLRQLGYNTICESNGESALETAIATQPSAIVLDLIMPVMTGFEFLDRLRADPAGRNVPVIVWTSKDLTAEERASLKMSASAVVAKGREASSRVVAELAAVLPVVRAAS
jgi:signal transduction histidine kinase/DNA-binding response OmpR family regulator/HAMP domain-containing protein